MRNRWLLVALAGLMLTAALLLGATLGAHAGENDTAAHNREVALRLMAALSSGRLEGVEEVVDDQGDFTPAKARGMQALRRTYFPDLRYTVEEVVAEGDKVVVWYTVSGHHTGGDDAIPATGNPLQIPEVALLTFVDGRVRDRRLLTDLRSLQKALGFREVAPSSSGG